MTLAGLGSHLLLLPLLLGQGLGKSSEAELVVPEVSSAREILGDGGPQLEPTEPNLCLFECMQEGLTQEELDMVTEMAKRGKQASANATAAQGPADGERRLVRRTRSYGESVFSSQVFNSSLLGAVCAAYRVSSQCSTECGAALPQSVERGLDSLGKVKYLCSAAFLASIPCFREHRGLVDGKCLAVRPAFRFGSLGKDCAALETATACATPVLTLKCGPIAGAELGFLFAQMSYLALLDLVEDASILPPQCQALESLAQRYDRTRKLLRETKEELAAAEESRRLVGSLPPKAFPRRGPAAFERRPSPTRQRFPHYFGPAASQGLSPKGSSLAMSLAWMVAMLGASRS